MYKRQGYVLLTLTKTEAKAEYMAVSTILSEDYTVAPMRTFTVTPVAGGGVSGLKAV